jgi:hypothetical protein
LWFAFETRELRDICGSEQIAKEKLGREAGAALVQLLADLRAAATLRELPAGLHEAEFSDNECIFSLPEGCRLYVAPNHPKNPVAGGEQTDWSGVARIKISKIERDQ